MDSEAVGNFCNLLEIAATKKEAICVTFSCKDGNMTMTFVPYEYSYQDNNLYVESREDNNINIKHIDAIFYDEMEEIYAIVCGNTNVYISRV